MTHKSFYFAVSASEPYFAVIFVQMRSYYDSLRIPLATRSWVDP